MKKGFMLGGVALILTFGTLVYAQGPGMMGGYGGGYGMSPGMMGPGYGGGYGMGPGMMGGWIDVPAKLPAPKNKEWVQKLREILILEKQSLAQYQTDQEKFNAYMPYMMVIPQEYNHIAWIENLFSAYGLSSDGKVSPVVDNKTLREAYELSAKMESDLLPRYEWLVKNAEDRDSAQVLNTILMQSRWHLVMFEHALRMGHGYGFSRGPGRMGQGMMGGYGYGMGPGMMGPGYGGGYGMGPGMMGPGWGGRQGYGQGYGQREECQKYFDETAGMRKELNNKRFDYSEALRNPKTKPEEATRLEKEIWELQKKIYSEAPAACR